MALWTDILGGLVKPLTDLAEHMTVSGDEKAKIQQAAIAVQANAAMALVDYEKQLLAAQTDIVKAEANSQSWIARNWRPITMLTFLALVVADSLGYLPFRLATEAWELLKIGLGGYVVGRSVEKVAPAITSAIAGKK